MAAKKKVAKYTHESCERLIRMGVEAVITDAALMSDAVRKDFLLIWLEYIGNGVRIILEVADEHDELAAAKSKFLN